MTCSEPNNEIKNDLFSQPNESLKDEHRKFSEMRENMPNMQNFLKKVLTNCFVCFSHGSL